MYRVSLALSSSVRLPFILCHNIMYKQKKGCYTIHCYQRNSMQQKILNVMNYTMKDIEHCNSQLFISEYDYNTVYPFNIISDTLQNAVNAVYNVSAAYGIKRITTFCRRHTQLATGESGCILFMVYGFILTVHWHCRQKTLFLLYHCFICIVIFVFDCLYSFLDA